MTFLLRAALVLALAASGSSMAAAEVAASSVPKDKQTKLGKYYTPKEAAETLQKDGRKLVFLDVRTRGEVEFVGLPVGIDAHVPYADLNEFGSWDAKAGRYKIDLNSNFGGDVGRAVARKGLGKDAQIILICRSGDRSARAANLLADLGYGNVYTIVEGFEGDLSKGGRRTVNGWKNAGLPWTYRLERAQAYLPPN